MTWSRWLVVGDSLSATTATDWMTKMVPGVLGRTLTSSVAFGGSQTSAILTQWTAQKTRNPSRLFVLGGVNDMRNSVSAATAFANLSTIYSEAVAQGCQVVAMITPPCGLTASWTGAKQTQLDLLRASILGSANITTLVDFYSLMGEPGTPANLAAIYDSGDGLHPNSAGTTFMANTIATAIGL